MKYHRKRVFAVTGLAAIAALVATALFVVPARATPSSGVTNPLAVIGRFPDGIDATARTDINPGTATDFWQTRLDAKGATDVHVLENIVAPGGTFGWHSHPGPSLVIVRSGTVTVYHAPDCTPQEFGPGTTFIDQGNTLHLVRNNSSSVTADLFVVSFVPAGFARRIDQPNPNPTICPN